MKSTKRNELSATVLNAMSVFGGVQVVNILCSIIRTKLVAVWIGAAGVGLFGLYSSAIELLSSIFHLGLRSSAVRDIASSQASSVSGIITVVRRWSGALGVFSAIATLALSPLLSEWTFGDEDHVMGFVVLSIVLLLSSISGGELAILQGLQRLRKLAKASVWGVIAGLAVSAPMFYYWGVDSVIPSLLAYSIVTTIATLLYREKEVKGNDVTFRETMTMGRGFIVLGLYMTISGFCGMLVSYVFMAYLNTTADVDAVGYYQAGYTIVNKYVGLIFAAIAMEYYPRLAKANDNSRRISTFVSHEMALSLWILIPVIAVFITADNLIVRLLYSDEFSVIIPFIMWAMVGTVFRAVSWCMAFVILARGDGKIYLLTESLSSGVGLGLNILFYEEWGINGLGVAYLIWYIIYTIMVGIVYKYRYGLTLGKGIAGLVVFATVMCVAAVILSMYVGWWASMIVAMIGVVFSFRRLKRRL